MATRPPDPAPTNEVSAELRDALVTGLESTVERQYERSSDGDVPVPTLAHDLVEALRGAAEEAGQDDLVERIDSHWKGRFADRLEERLGDLLGKRRSKPLAPTAVRELVFAMAGIAAEAPAAAEAEAGADGGEEIVRVLEETMVQATAEGVSPAELASRIAAALTPFVYRGDTTPLQALTPWLWKGWFKKATAEEITASGIEVTPAMRTALAQRAVFLGGRDAALAFVAEIRSRGAPKLLKGRAPRKSKGASEE